MPVLPCIHEHACRSSSAPYSAPCGLQQASPGPQQRMPHATHSDAGCAGGGGSSHCCAPARATVILPPTAYSQPLHRSPTAWGSARARSPPLAALQRAEGAAAEVAMGRHSDAGNEAAESSHSSPLLTSHLAEGASPRVRASPSPRSLLREQGEAQVARLQLGGLKDCNCRRSPPPRRAAWPSQDLAPPCRPSPAATFPRNVSICQLAGGASDEESAAHKRVRA